MTSRRCYQPIPKSHQEAVEEIRRCSGTQFDPNCVEAMLHLLEREGEAFISRDQKFDIHAFLEV